MRLNELEKAGQHFPVVGIGASAGGLDAFKKFIKAIPQKTGMAFVLVQHLDPKHESLLPELLQKEAILPVKAVADDLKIEPDNIYVIPSNKILIANDDNLQVIARDNISNADQRLPIDIFFNTLAEVHQTNAIGVILSGTASDGTKGLKSIKDYGGITFAQDKESASYDGMPSSAIRAGVVDFIMAPEKIPQKIIEITKQISMLDGDSFNTSLKSEDVFKQIVSIIRIRKGTDFSSYKRPTIHRRIFRRMALKKMENPLEYVQYLRENKIEQDLLYQDLLIPVTSFFRDKAVFDNLKDNIFPRLFKNKAEGQAIRIWVAGCSTGEEAYSIAICLKEIIDKITDKVQIFATDISEPAIEKARLGIYSKSETDGLSPERLQSFFTKSHGSYHVNKQVRDMCVFAVHNFVHDPPFGRMDFISCRNVLIYLDPYLQKKALTTFHYSLNSRGYLLLGKSETKSSVAELFAVVDNPIKLFIRNDTIRRSVYSGNYRKEQINFSEAMPLIEPKKGDFHKIADDLLLSKFTPPAVIINEAWDVVHMHGKMGNYLEFTNGRPSHNILKMARQELNFELRRMLYKLIKNKKAIKKPNIPLQINESIHNITLEAVHLKDTMDPYYLILFHEEENGIKNLPVGKTNLKDTNQVQIKKLEEELVRTHEDLRSITEEQEVANEELQSANEELLSSSEELQSLNEELETNNEELQSTNEELMIVNQEMISLNAQITRSRDYAEALVSTLGEPLVILDRNFRVKSANLAFYKTFEVDERNTEDKLIYTLGNNQWDIPELRELLEKILPEKSVFFGFEMTHNFPNIGERTMLLNAREIVKEDNNEPLILLAIRDVTDKRIVEKNLAKSENKFQRLAEFMPQMVWTGDQDGKQNYFNQNFLDFIPFNLDELIKQGWHIAIHPDDWKEDKKIWENALENSHDFKMQHRILNKNGEYIWFLTRGISTKDELGNINMWICTSTEIQDQKTLQEVLEKAIEERTNELQGANKALVEKNRELQSFAYVTSHDLQEPLRKFLTFMERIKTNESKNLSAEGLVFLNRMGNTILRMRQLITDLLTFSKIDMEERKFEKTKLSKSIREVARELKESLAVVRAKIVVEAEDEINVVPFQFQQLMHNLINNSIKYSKPGVPLKIIIKSNIAKGKEFINKDFEKFHIHLNPEKLYCHLSVADNGIGFESQYSLRIFEIFQKLHSRDQYAGTGIGLAIVKRIIETHNAFITADGELDKAAVFNMYFPV